MRFESIALRSFRNFEAAKIAWGPGLNFILGPNGSGKTNLLESLNILAGWGSLLGRTGGTVSWDSPDGRALLAARTTGETGHEIMAALSSRMALKLDGKHVNCTELRLVIPSFTFLPTDVDLIDGPPSVRRVFMDKLCALCFPPYARRLSEFHQVYRHRAALLRDRRDACGTDIPFAQLGGWIMESRRVVLSHLLDAPRSLCGGEDVPFSLAAQPELPAGSNGPEYLLSALRALAEREARAMRPLVGPGRDDLRILSGGRPASEALSRGQKRRVVLSLVLMAGRLIELRLRRKPVLLFDDLWAELDAGGRRAALEALGGTGWQVFLAGTEAPVPGPSGAHVLELPMR